MAPKPEVRRSPVAALLYVTPIGLLGGLRSHSRGGGGQPYGAPSSGS
jgi:hypothetical protein